MNAGGGSQASSRPFDPDEWVADYYGYTGDGRAFILFENKSVLDVEYLFTSAGQVTGKPDRARVAAVRIDELLVSFEVAHLKHTLH